MPTLLRVVGLAAGALLLSSELARLVVGRPLRYFLEIQLLFAEAFNRGWFDRLGWYRWIAFALALALALALGLGLGLGSSRLALTLAL